MPLDANALTNAALSALPSILGLLQSHHAAANPDGAPLTTAQALAALQAAVAASLEEDARLKAARAPLSAEQLGHPYGSTGE